MENTKSLSERTLDTMFQQLLDAHADRIVERTVAAIHAQPLRPRLFDVKSAAKYLGRSEHAVRHLCTAGKLPTKRIDGRLMFDIKVLDRYIDAQ